MRSRASWRGKSSRERSMASPADWGCQKTPSAVTVSSGAMSSARSSTPSWLKPRFVSGGGRSRAQGCRRRRRRHGAPRRRWRSRGSRWRRWSRGSPRPEACEWRRRWRPTSRGRVGVVERGLMAVEADLEGDRECLRRSPRRPRRWPLRSMPLVRTVILARAAAYARRSKTLVRRKGSPPVRKSSATPAAWASSTRRSKAPSGRARLGAVGREEVRQ